MTLQSLRMFFVTPSWELGLFIAMTTGMMFGIAPPLGHAAYDEGTNFVLVAIVSMFCRGLFLVCYCLYKRLGLFSSRKTLKTTASGAFCHAFAMAAFFGSLSFLPAPVAMIIEYIFPLGLLLFLVWKGEEKLSFLTLFVVLAALGGLSLVLNVWDVQSEIRWVGVALAILAAVGVASRMYIHGRQLLYRSPYVVGAENFILAFLFTLPLALWKAPILPHSTMGYVWIGLGGLAFGLGSFWAFSGMAMTGAFTWALLGKIEPVYAAIFSALCFHEYLTTSQYIGMALVLGSLVAYRLTTRPKPVPETGE